MPCLLLAALALPAVVSADRTPEGPLSFTMQAGQRGPSDDSPFGGVAVEGRAETTWFGGFTVVDGEYHALSGANKQTVMRIARVAGTFRPTRLMTGTSWSTVSGKTIQIRSILGRQSLWDSGFGRCYGLSGRRPGVGGPVPVL